MMYFKKNPDVLGNFVAADGSCYSIAAARRIRTATGINIGYEAFESLQDALAAWELVPVEQVEENV